ncbi:MAG: response regulator transcription factor [Bacteroidales bacterium]|nr:response regulator transcription factor [Bacteroidales bacterium]
MKAVIFDEIEIIRIGLLNIFNHSSDIIVIDDFNSFDELSDFLALNCVDLIIADFFQSENFDFDFFRSIKKRNKNTKILVFSNVLDKKIIFSSIRAGVDGYLHKTAVKEEIIDAVRKVKENNEYFSENVSNIILKSYLSNVKYGEEISEKKPRNLTRREIQILKLVCDGMTNQQIADGLCISIRTVDTHKSNIMQKLQLKTTADLVAFAFKSGLVAID